MSATKLLIWALFVLSASMFLQMGGTSAWAQRGCKMGSDCNYGSNGATTNKIPTGNRAPKN